MSTKTATPTSGHTAEERETKKARIGVGTSVATLTRHATDDFFIILIKTAIERLLPKTRKVFTAYRLDRLPTTFERLVEHNVLGMPVLTQEGKYHGYIEVTDILRFIIGLFSDVAAVQLIDIQRVFDGENRYMQTAVHDVMTSPVGKVPRYHAKLKGYSLFSAWETLALSGTHRLPVIDEEEHVVDIITQSMLIDFLWQNLEQIGSAADAPVSSIPSPPGVVSVHESSKAILGFRLMLSENVSAVAVVNDKGALVDNLSARDLKALRPDVNIFWRLWNTVSEFKEKVRSEFANHPSPPEPVVVTEADPLKDVVEKMATLHIHRVFVVDSRDSMKPQRVISQTDVLRALLRGLD